MNGFNLSAWAIAHRSIVYFLMLAIVVIGIASYMRLGRNEDPTFTIKTMVVQAQWPGATLEDTLLQVTERIERKLQETPHLDYLKSYTKAGQSTVFVYLKGSTGPKAVSDAWYQVRKKVRDIELTLPQGVSAPVATTNSATPMASSMDSPRTGSRIASCATTWRISARSCCRCQMSPK